MYRFTCPYYYIKLNVHIGTEFSYFLLPLCWPARGEIKETSAEGKELAIRREWSDLGTLIGFRRK